jgi:hypothetical protein
MPEPETGSLMDRAWLMAHITGALPPDSGLSPLPKLNTDVTGRGNFLKVYFGVRCQCTTAAVLSAEVAAGKTRADVIAATPALVRKLAAQRDAFRRMPCSSHKALRSAGFAGDRKGAPDA